MRNAHPPPQESDDLDDPDVELSEDISHNMVVSYRAADPAVYAVCHHSGRYLTRDEYNQALASVPLHEQHDFPGLPELDRRYRRAAHDADFKHLSWSKIGINGIGRLISAALLLAGAITVLLLLDFIAGLVEALALLGAATIGIVLAVILASQGIAQLTQRTRLFHAWAKRTKQPPAVADFPVLDCRYQMNAREQYRIRLSNVRDDLSNANDSASVSTCEGRLSVTVDPPEAVQKQFDAYREVYALTESVGTFAGMIALDQLNGVDFLRQAGGGDENGGVGLDLSHRIVLRSTAATTSEIQSLQHNYDYQIKREVLFSPIEPHVQAGSEREMFDADDVRSKLILECVPELDPRDSRLLHLHLRWLGRPDVNWVLEECRIVIPDTLEDVLLVERGRIDKSGIKNALWRNLPLNGQLTLSLRFAKPILQVTPELTGSYRMRSDDLVSGLDVQGGRIWDAMGLPASDSGAANSTIQRESVIEGDIHLQTSQLTHQHEVIEIRRLTCDRRADHELVGAFLQALVATGVNVQRTEQSRPHTDPSDANDIQVAYWDVTGRSYRLGGLDPIDIHAVMAGRYVSDIGSSSPADGMPAAQATSTSIELRLRCLHDPRNDKVGQEVRTTAAELVSMLQTTLGARVADQADL